MIAVLITIFLILHHIILSLFEIYFPYIMFLLNKAFEDGWQTGAVGADVHNDWDVVF